mmetsp:Transcript_8250/g.7310  ORF Transcript_8250/g.7310 Transcript_8250/m.7310 type:complete len:214 (+) Transcript_8250:847-1488(+)
MENKKFASQKRKETNADHRINVYELPRSQPQEVIQEESECSESTDNFVTSYQHYRGKQKVESFYPRKESDISINLTEDDKREASLQYSLSSGGSERKEFDSDSSISNYYSAGKSNFFSKIDKSSIELASEFNSYRKKIEDSKFSLRNYSSSSDSERENQTTTSKTSINPQKDKLLSTYNKLLTDIRGVIQNQRENIMKKIPMNRDYDSDSSDY